MPKRDKPNTLKKESVHKMSNKASQIQIIRATHQHASKKFFKDSSRGKQSVAMSCMSILQTKCSNPLSWATPVLDEILKYGDNLYKYLFIRLRTQDCCIN